MKLSVVRAIFVIVAAVFSLSVLADGKQAKEPKSPQPEMMLAGEGGSNSGLQKCSPKKKVLQTLFGPNTQFSKQTGVAIVENQFYRHVRMPVQRVIEAKNPANGDPLVEYVVRYDFFPPRGFMANPGVKSKYAMLASYNVDSQTCQVLTESILDCDKVKNLSKNDPNNSQYSEFCR